MSTFEMLLEKIEREIQDLSKAIDRLNRLLEHKEEKRHD
jgi:hypothetical protein